MSQEGRWAGILVEEYISTAEKVIFAISPGVNSENTEKKNNKGVNR